MRMFAFLLLSVALSAQAPLDVKVESTVDKKTSFAAFRTYRWQGGVPASNPTAHKMIVAAIEAEMKTLGFTQAATGSDVTLSYYTVTSAYADLKALEEMRREGRGGNAPTTIVGRLVVAMRVPSSIDPVWSASTLEHVDPDPAKLNDTIRNVTARLFATYPGRKPARQ